MLDIEEHRRKVEELKRKIIEQKKKGNSIIDSGSAKDEEIEKMRETTEKTVVDDEINSYLKDSKSSLEIEEDEELDYNQQKEIATRKLIDETRKKVEQAYKKDIDGPYEKGGKKISQKPLASSDSVLLIQAYTQVLKVAWSDGILSKEESAILSTLRKVIGITEEEHNNLEQEVQMEIYLQAIVDSWKNGAITPEDLDRLDVLRERFNISAEEHLRLERQVRKEILRQK